MLYPNGKKIVPYMNAIKEFYADYIMPDGLVKRTTFYTEPEYLNKIYVQEIYKNRIDKLICTETKYAIEGTETIEYFRPGRDDYLKSNILRTAIKKNPPKLYMFIFTEHKFYGDCNNIETRRLVTFYKLRLDAMADIKINENSFIITYNDRFVCSTNLLD